MTAVNCASSVFRPTNARDVDSVPATCNPLMRQTLTALSMPLTAISPRGSQARAMVLAYIFGSFFRETWHYRHFWLFLPLALVVAEQARRANPEVEVVLE